MSILSVSMSSVEVVENSGEITTCASSVLSLLCLLLFSVGVVVVVAVAVVVGCDEAAADENCTLCICSHVLP